MSLASEEQDENDRHSMALLGSRGTATSEGAPSSITNPDFGKNNQEVSLPPRKADTITENSESSVFGLPKKNIF